MDETVKIDCIRYFFDLKVKFVKCFDMDFVSKQLNSILFPAHHIPSVKSALRVGVGSSIACHELTQLFWNDIQNQSVDPESLRIYVTLGRSGRQMIENGVTSELFHAIAACLEASGYSATHKADSIACFDKIDASLQCVASGGKSLCLYRKTLFKAEYAVDGPFDLLLEAIAKIESCNGLQPHWSQATKVYSRQCSAYHTEYWSFKLTKWTHADKNWYDVALSLDVKSALKLRSTEVLATALYECLIWLCRCIEPVEKLQISLLRQTW